MLRKCEKCHGRGGCYVGRRGCLMGVFVDCLQCRGKGKWYPAQQPKRNKKQ